MNLTKQELNLAIIGALDTYSADIPLEHQHLITSDYNASILPIFEKMLSKPDSSMKEFLNLLHEFLLHYHEFAHTGVIKEAVIKMVLVVENNPPLEKTNDSLTDLAKLIVTEKVLDLTEEQAGAVIELGSIYKHYFPFMVHVLFYLKGNVKPEQALLIFLFQQLNHYTSKEEIKYALKLLINTVTLKDPEFFVHHELFHDAASTQLRKLETYRKYYPSLAVQLESSDFKPTRLEDLTANDDSSELLLSDIREYNPEDLLIEVTDLTSFIQRVEEMHVVSPKLFDNIKAYLDQSYEGNSIHKQLFNKHLIELVAGRKTHATFKLMMGEELGYPHSNLLTEYYPLCNCSNTRIALNFILHS